MGSGDHSCGTNPTWPQISHYTLLSSVSSAEEKVGVRLLPCIFHKELFLECFWAQHSNVYAYSHSGLATATCGFVDEDTDLERLGDGPRTTPLTSNRWRFEAGSVSLLP